MRVKRWIAGATAALFFGAGVAFSQPPSTPVMKAWRDGFYAGYNYALTEVAKLLKKHADLLNSIAEWKELLIAGEIPPIHIKVNFSFQKTRDGSYRVIRTVSVEPLSVKDLEAISYFKRRIVAIQKQTSKVVPGWWVVKDVSNVPRVDIAFYKFYVQKQGLSPMVPMIVGSKLVFAIADRKADADYIKSNIVKAGIDGVQVIKVDSISGEVVAK